MTTWTPPSNETLEQVLALIYDRVQTPNGQRAYVGVGDGPAEVCVVEVIAATLADHELIRPDYNHDDVRFWRQRLGERAVEQQVMPRLTPEDLREVADLVDALLALAERAFDQTLSAERTTEMVLTLQRGARWYGFLDLVARSAAALVEVNKIRE